MSDTPTKTNRPLDVAPSASFGEFMSSGWTPSNLQGLTPSPAAPWCVERRKALSMAFLGVRVILPAGNFKVRSNDSDFRYRPHSAFAYYAGVQGAEATADAVFILEPTNQGHDALLFINPRSTRDTEDFYRNSKYGELWVGRRFTTDEAQQRWQIETRKVESLKEFLADGKESILLRGQDAAMDALVKVSAREDELAMFVSAARLIKDAYEVEEMQKACDSTARGFADVVRAFPAAISTPRGERVIEAAFFGRARVEGNDIGYDTIAASGAHACVLHWNRNDGDVRLGELLLLDAGVERESYYTADVTRTLPISGKFTPAQRSLYMLVLEAQKAGFAAVKPGAKFADINVACQTVLAHGLADMGVLPISPEESLHLDRGFHKRWTLHGVSHMVGMDVHDCSQARREQYDQGVLQPGHVLTVEPGLYIQPDDELFAPEFRGIGIRIEDDVVVTNDGCRILSNSLPRHPDDIEKWMAELGN